MKDRQQAIDAYINDKAGKYLDLVIEIDGREVRAAEVSKRARELGWINGYKWGVAYTTNGAEPDLSDDVVLEFESERLIGWNKATVGIIAWVFVKTFRLIDERYKPVEQSHIPAENKVPAPHGVIKLVEDWYDYEQQKDISLPPVGIECEYKLADSDQWHFCVIISHNQLVINSSWVACECGSENGLMLVGDLVGVKFRPLDHATRAKEVEKKRFIEQAISVFYNGDHYERMAAALFDAGFKLP